MARVSIPTTYARSEMAPMLEETKEIYMEVTRTDRAAIPASVTYDASLTLTPPPTPTHE